MLKQNVLIGRAINMKKIVCSFFLSVFFLWALPAVFSQIPGKKYSERLSDFSKLELSGSMTVIVKRGGSNNLTAEIKMGGSYSELDFYVSNNTLFLKKRGSFFAMRNITVTLTSFCHIDVIYASGGVLVKTWENVFSSKAEVDAKSSSVMEIYVEADKFYAVAGRTSSIKLRGKVEEIELRAEHEGKIDSEFLEAEKGYAFAYTGGSIKLTVLNYLEAAAGNNSVIYYKDSLSLKKELSPALEGKYISY